MVVQQMKNRAIEDPEVRAAVWATVCLAAEQLHSCAVLLPSVKKAKPQEISNNSPVPSFRTWRLVEALSLLGILLRADSVKTKAEALCSYRPGGVCRGRRAEISVGSAGCRS